MKTSRLAHGANPCGATHPCASASSRPAQPGRSLIHLAAILCLALIGQTATATSVNLAWNPNPEADVTSYKLCYGTSPGTYSNILSTGTATGTPVSGLTEGATYYFSVKAVNTAGLESEPSSEVSFQVPVTPVDTGSLIPQSGWAVHDVNSHEQPAYAAALAIDGNPNTFWHTEWVNRSSPPPNHIAIDLGVAQWISGFRYLPRQDNYDVGNIGRYEFYVSRDGVNWGSPVASGVFANSKSEKEVLFTSTSGRYVKLLQLTEVNDDGACNVAELNLVMGEATTTPPVAVNQAPVAAGLPVSTNEDKAVAITLSASDADGNPLSYRIVSGPAMGALSGSAPNLTYTPTADANGSDSFTFVANDGLADSNTATVSINIIPVNDTPRASAQTVSTSEDKAVGILLSASDKDGDTLSYRIVSGPAMGTLSGSAPNLTYTPKADINGSDSFTFVANDGKADSSTATVSITINALNDAPVASARSVTTTEDKAVGILLSASDKDGDALTYQIVANPAKGSLTGTAPNLTYMPNANFNGSDSLSFRVNDGKTDSVAATVSITITAVNDAPAANAQMVAATAGKPAAIVLSASDPDGDSLTFSIVSNPIQGSLSGTPPNLTYTPNANATGTDSLSFRTSDGKTSSNTATVSITITAGENTENKAPVFQADLLTRSGGKTSEAYVAESLAGTAVDPDGDKVSYLKVAGPEWLVVSPEGNISGTPSSTAEGINSFTIRAADPSGAFDEAVLEITIQPGAQLPLPWNLGRIGTISQEATAWGEATALAVKSSGALSGSSDNGLFTWQTLSGDGEIIARISTLENANSNSRIGLEIRESQAANSRHVFIGTDGAGLLYMINRNKTGGSTSLSKVGIGVTPNLWLRLTRNGNAIIASISTNGSSWTRVSRMSLSLAPSAYIGLMTSGGNNLSTGVFQNVNVVP